MCHGQELNPWPQVTSPVCQPLDCRATHVEYDVLWIVAETVAECDESCLCDKQYLLQDFEATWQMSVPDDMTTHLLYLEVYIFILMYISVLWQWIIISVTLFSTKLCVVFSLYHA